MKLGFIGDTHDCWKGFLLETIERSGLWDGLSVDAMATDYNEWKEEDWQAYAGFLKVPRPQIIRHDSSLLVDRERYFQEILTEGDLFLDPDTGIATRRAREPLKKSRIVR